MKKGLLLVVLATIISTTVTAQLNFHDYGLETNNGNITELDQIKYKNSIKIGNGSLTTNDPGDIVIGKEAGITDSTGGHQEIALGYQATVESYKSTAIGGKSTVSGNNGLAVGFGSNSVGTSIAVGSQSNASDGSSAAVGYDSNAVEPRSVALGTTAKANKTGSVAIGWYALADEKWEAQFGRADGGGFGKRIDVDVTGNLTVRGQKTIVQDLEINGSCTGCEGGGSGTAENLSQTLAAGNKANQSIGFADSQPVTIGNGSLDTNDHKDVVIGKEAEIKTSDTYSGSSELAIGYNATVETYDSTAIGGSSRVSGNNGLAVGFNSNSVAASIAIGSGSNASDGSSAAVGYNSKAVQPRTVALGTSAKANKKGSIALGWATVADKKWEAQFGSITAQDYTGRRIGVDITGNLTVRGSGGLNLTGSKITSAELAELDQSTLGTCGTSTEGQIRYNGTGHYGCNGTAWNKLY